ncbi:MAG: hypothetical protein Q9173_000545 [Seirophora scorigena]
MAENANVSSDLIWEVCRPNNAFLVKRKSAGGSQFSRDPLNLMNKHSRKYDGFVNDKVCALTLLNRLLKGENPPKDKIVNVDFDPRRIYKGIVDFTVKQNYRADLRQEAVARASAIRQSNRAKKGTPEKKVRGAKAKAVAEKDT